MIFISVHVNAIMLYEKADIIAHMTMLIKQLLRRQVITVMFMMEKIILSGRDLRHLHI